MKKRKSEVTLKLIDRVAKDQGIPAKELSVMGALELYWLALPDKEWATALSDMEDKSCDGMTDEEWANAPRREAEIARIRDQRQA